VSFMQAKKEQAPSKARGLSFRYQEGIQLRASILFHCSSVSRCRSNDESYDQQGKSDVIGTI